MCLLCGSFAADVGHALDFQRFAAVPPSGAFVSEPAVRPFLAPGVAAPVGQVLPVDTRRDGRADLPLCHAVYPPDPKSKQPCRFLRPQSDGLLADAEIRARARPSVPVSHRVHVFMDQGERRAA